MNLNEVWFLLLGVLLAGYAILDGFDLGVGIIHPLTRSDHERRVAMNAIGPLWDGNEVWLVTFGGAMFAAFPEAYATIFSAFYLPFIALLFCLILRAVSLEFRSKRPGRAWRTFWDYAFFGSCLGATMLFGVAVGDSIVGLDLDASHNYQGGLSGLLKPYALIVGALAVSMFALHGTLFLRLKTEGKMQERLGGFAWVFFAVATVMFLVTTGLTLKWVPRAVVPFDSYPWLWLAPLLTTVSWLNIPRALYRRRVGEAFFSSCAFIFSCVLLFGAALFPTLVHSVDPQNSLTIYNAASSPKTLRIMFIIALIGMPFVATYTTAIYWTYRGKVELDEFSY